MTSFRLFPFPPLLLLFRCAIIIRNRFDSASTVACIRSRERMYVQKGVCWGVSKLNPSLRIISRKEERDGFTPFLRNM